MVVNVVEQSRETMETSIFNGAVHGTKEEVKTVTTLTITKELRE